MKRLDTTLSKIETTSQRRGLSFKSEHASHDGAFARVRVSYFGTGEKSFLEQLTDGDESALVSCLLGIQSGKDGIRIELQSISGVKHKLYQNVITDFLLALVKIGLDVRDMEGLPFIHRMLGEQKTKPRKTKAANGAGEGQGKQAEADYLEGKPIQRPADELVSEAPQQSTQKQTRNDMDKIVSERLSGLRPMLTTTREESHEAIRYKVFSHELVILEVRISDTGLSFPFAYPNDQMTTEVTMSLLHATTGIPMLPGGVDITKADEYLQMAMMMFESSGGAFPNYSQAGSRNARLNQILRFSPNRDAQNAATANNGTKTQQPQPSAATPKEAAKFKRGKRGRKPTPPNERLKHVESWLAIQHHTTQAQYCSGKGISPSSLRDWIGEYERGELKAN